MPSVPGVTATLQILRKAFPVEEQVELDALLAKHREAGEKYRQAFQFLGIRRPPALSERVLKIATLRAYDRTGIDENDLLSMAPELEANQSGWKLPPGQAALGRILSGLPPRLRGPVFTTNFDPLTEIAVRRAGGVATPYIHADDSSFIANLRVQTGASVIHLHGYWRDSQVRNTSDQLEQDRPNLAASLRVTLERHTLLVIGYGGWSDVISRSLLSAIRQQQSGELDVLWCLHESERELTTGSSSEETLSGFSSAPGNVQFYAGIDANVVLPMLEKRIASVLSYDDGRRLSGASLLGWTTITRSELDEVKPNATVAAALTFFDGRIPSWHDAVSSHIPRRDSTIQIFNEISASDAAKLSTLTVLTGPSGEGKSTVSRQVAAMLASDESQNFRVFVLEGDHFGTLASILRLPTDASYLLLIDEAHRFVNRIQDLVKDLQASGRYGIHLLVVSGDTDWASVGGSNFAWNRFVSTNVHQLNGLTHIDATAMVGAWEAIGAKALGELQWYDSQEQRVDALLDFSFGEAIAGPGTLLGALLTTRYDRKGLREHIKQLLERLRTRLIPPANNSSLLDALVAISVPHAYGVFALNSSVLADAFDMSPVELNAYILIPLGEEAAITFASGHIVVRHELIASAIIDLCLETGYDLESATKRIVAAAARHILHGGYSPGMAQITYLASRITDMPKLALVAADAAVEAAPDRLSYRTSRSKVLRTARRAIDAATENESSLPLILHPDNVNQARGYFVEWGVVEGLLENFARNAMLAGVALQDGVSLGGLDTEQSERGLSCLVLALRRLQENNPQPEILQALAAATVLARACGQKSATGREWLRVAERMVDKNGASYPKLDGSDSATKALRIGLNACRARLERPFPTAFPRTDFQFLSLQRLLANPRQWY
ncbi:SIR2 family protein [Subtercola boreus]|uniref:P-loop NTPase n=1 Tax=Subtercola boreus TaxID=120213 RepID=UPI0014767317|nr:SIR2 family protein [Subtercola boreus]